MSRVEALPFLAEVRLAVLRAFVSGLRLAVSLTKLST